MRRRLPLRYWIRAALIAALYIVLVYLFQPISFGPGQIRVAESLAVLPLLEAAAVPGLAVGCLLANLLGGMGLWDVFGGSFITLVAAYLTSQTRHLVLGIVPPIVLNAFGVSAYLSFLLGIPYWLLVGQIFFGQVLAVAGLGSLLFWVLWRLRSALDLSHNY